MYRLYPQTRISILVILLLGSLTSSFGQSLSWLTSDNLLQDNYVRGIVQDKYGYIWMATTSGLARYDGYSIDFIKPERRGDKRLMPDSRILAVSNWTDKFIWVQLRGHRYSCYDVDKDRLVDFTGDSTFSGTYKKYSFLNGGDLMLFDAQKDGKLIHYDGKKFISKNVKLPPYNIANIISVENDIYLITEECKFFKYVKGKFHQVFSAKISGGANKVVDAEFFNGLIYLNTLGGIYEYDLSRQSITKSQYNPPAAYIEKDNNENLLIFAYDGSSVYYLTPQKTYHIHGIYNEHLIRLNKAPNYRFFTDHIGNLWISTYGNGIMKFDIKSNVLQSYSHLLPSLYTFQVFEDKAENLWVCQENMGVGKFTPRKNTAHYFYYKDNDEVSHLNNIRLLRYIDQKMYIANTQNSLIVLNEQFGERIEINTYKDDVLAIAKDKSGRLCVGTRKNGIYVDGKNYRHTSNNQSLSEGKVNDIIIDSKGRMWLSVFESGIDLMSGENFIHVFGNQQITQPRGMTMDTKGNIWVCTSEGALCFQPDELIRNSNAYRFVNVSKGDPKTDEIHSIYIDSKQRIWIGSVGHGVMMINGNDTTVYTTSEGLANNNVQSIVEDKAGNIWIGTDNGMSKWNGIKMADNQKKLFSTNENFSNYYFSTNILGNNYTEDNAIRLPDGRLVFATHHGVVTFDPQRVQLEKPAFNLALTNIGINGISIFELKENILQDNALVKTHKISLRYNQNSLVFYFSDFNFTTQHKSKFIYYLEGYDKTWSSLSEINFAQYKNLPAGNYTLHARSCNANGVWSSGEVTLNIRIRPPFWASWWAYLIYIFAITVATLYLYKNFQRINSLRNSVKLEKELTEYKLQFFTNISHEFRTPLTIIRGEMDRLKTMDEMPSLMKKPLSSMNRSVLRMMRLTNQLLEFRKMQDNKLQLALEKTDVITYVQNIFYNFKGMAESKSINFQFLPFDKNYEMFVDKNYLDKIIYNLLSNALKYTPTKGEVTLLISLSENYELLIVTVEDSGVGVDKERQSQLFQFSNRSNYSHDSIGIGLHLTSELVKAHCGRISFFENSPKGSVFQVELPVDERIYKPNDFMVTDGNELLNEENINEFEYSTIDEVQHEPINPQWILIAEDDDDIRDFVKRELQRYFNVEVAIDGKDAWGKMKDRKPELLVSDVMMPHLNGYDLITRIRADEDLADIPVLLLTALTEDKKKIQGYNSGADAYIEKPFNIKLLVATCCQLIEQRRNLKIAYGKKTVAIINSAQPDVIKDNEDKKFIILLDAWLNEHLTDSQLNIDLFAQSIGYARTSFYKKIKRTTGLTPNEYIQTVRMNRAIELLRDDRNTIAEVAYRVGINDPYYFSRLFKNFFGVSPSKYRSGSQSPQSEA